MKKATMKTRIIAAVLAVISTFSLTAFAATSVSAAETNEKATAAQSDDGVPDIFWKISDLIGRNTNESAPDPAEQKVKTTVKTQNGEK